MSTQSIKIVQYNRETQTDFQETEEDSHKL